MQILTFSKKGKEKAEKEDYYLIEIMEDVTVAIVLDGASSHNNSLLGAKNIAYVMRDFVISNKQMLWDLFEDTKKVKVLLINIIRDGLTKTAIDNHVPYESLGSTLMMAVMQKDKLVCVHIGDGEIGCMDNERIYYSLSTPENGFSKFHTFLTTSKELENHLRIKKYIDLEAKILILFTDGAENMIRESISDFEDCYHLIENAKRSEYSDDASVVTIEI